MSNVGLGFYSPNEVRLSFCGCCLDVDFSDAEVSRLIVIEPAIRQALARIVATHRMPRIDWAELRVLLETQGLDLRAEIARSWAKPGRIYHRPEGFAHEGNPTA